MPLTAEIKINGNPTVVDGYPTFYHRYSGGAAVCIKKAIETLTLCGSFKTEPGGN